MKDRVYVAAGIVISALSLLVIFWLGAAAWHYEVAFIALLIGSMLWPLGLLRLISRGHGAADSENR